jgi:NAD(P)-dependent dehydrogenase (short-subunit alcohol dehydrogenase family)
LSNNSGLSREVGSRGISVNNVQPGPIDTDLNPASGDWAVPQKAITALNRYRHVEQVAVLVAFVAGPESSQGCQAKEPPNSAAVRLAQRGLDPAVMGKFDCLTWQARHLCARIYLLQEQAKKHSSKP